MSFNYNNQTWTPYSTEDHANELLNNINTVLKNNGMPALKPVFSNAMWLMILASAQMMNDKDNQLYDAQQSLNPALCSDDQLLNLLDISGTKLIQGSYSTVSLTVVATTNGSCFVPTGSRLQYTSDVYFETLTDLTVSAGSSGTVQAKANVKGNVKVAPNLLTSFQTQILNLASVTNPSEAVIGSNDETMNELRQRFVKGNILPFNVDACMRAIRGLDGVSACNIVFNYDPNNNLTLDGGWVIPPRNALVIINGDNEKIAETYFSYMTAKAYGEGQTEFYSIYNTLAGQELKLYYFQPAQQDVYVKVYIKETPSTQIKSFIFEALQTINCNIGKQITQEIICNALNNIAVATIVGAEMSLDNITYGYIAKIAASGYAAFPINKLSVEQVE